MASALTSKIVNSKQLGLSDPQVISPQVKTASITHGVSTPLSSSFPSPLLSSSSSSFSSSSLSSSSSSSSFDLKPLTRSNVVFAFLGDLEASLAEFKDRLTKVKAKLAKLEKKNSKQETSQSNLKSAIQKWKSEQNMLDTIIKHLSAFINDDARKDRTIKRLINLVQETEEELKEAEMELQDTKVELLTIQEQNHQNTVEQKKGILEQDVDETDLFKLYSEKLKKIKERAILAQEQEDLITNLNKIIDNKNNEIVGLKKLLEKRGDESTIIKTHEYVQEGSKGGSFLGTVSNVIYELAKVPITVLMLSTFNWPWSNE